jgi:hypothetical protein
VSHTDQASDDDSRPWTGWSLSSHAPSAKAGARQPRIRLVHAWRIWSDEVLLDAPERQQAWEMLHARLKSQTFQVRSGAQPLWEIRDRDSASLHELAPTAQVLFNGDGSEARLCEVHLTKDARQHPSVLGPQSASSRFLIPQQSSFVSARLVDAACWISALGLAYTVVDLELSGADTDGGGVDAFLDLLHYGRYLDSRAPELRLELAANPSRPAPTPIRFLPNAWTTTDDRRHEVTTSILDVLTEIERCFIDPSEPRAAQSRSRTIGLDDTLFAYSCIAIESRKKDRASSETDTPRVLRHIAEMAPAKRKLERRAGGREMPEAIQDLPYSPGAAFMLSRESTAFIVTGSLSSVQPL